MQRIKSVFQDSKSLIIDFIKERQTTKLLQLYTKGQHQKVLERVSTWKQYNRIEINNHHLIFFLISENNTELIKELLNLKYKQQILTDDINPNSFFPLTFSMLNSLEQMNDLLIAAGADFEQRHKDGNYLIHTGAYYNKPDAIKYLLKRNANINSQNDRGDTALHLAAVKGNLEVIDVLLQNKADTQIENVDNHLAVHEAVVFGQLDAYLKLKHTFKGMHKDQPHLVHLAAMLESNQILDNLIQANEALINLRHPKTIATPLHYSVNSGSQDCTEYLLRKGALVNAQDLYKNTPLHLAVESKQLSQIKAICEFKADITIENEDKLSPLDLAVGERDKTILDYFKSNQEYAYLFRD